MKKITAVLLTALTVGGMLTGCEEDKPDSTTSKPKIERKAKATDLDSGFRDRLDLSSSVAWKYLNSRIITDPQTGVEYIELYINKDRAAGVSITPRLTKDGKPFINPKYRKK